MTKATLFRLLYGDKILENAEQKTLYRKFEYKSMLNHSLRIINIKKTIQFLNNTYSTMNHTTTLNSNKSQKYQHKKQNI